MGKLRHVVLFSAALLASSPALARSCGGENGPCDPPPPAPKPDLPPPVISYGNGAALIPSGDPAYAGQSFVIGHDPDNYVAGATTRYATTGSEQIAPYGSGSAFGATTLGPVASAAAETHGSHGANQTPISALSNIFLTYQVAIHAVDQAAAAALQPFLERSGTIATVSGHMTLSALGEAYSAGIVTTGVGIFENGFPFAGTAAYGRLGSDPALLGRVQFSCAHTNFGFGTPDTSGCGTNGFTLPVNFVSATSYADGDSLDFIGNVELRAFAAGPNGIASAFVDPMVSLAAGLDPDLYTLTIGGGAVSNLLDAPAPGVPEPGSWALMLAGFAAMGTSLRRRQRPQQLVHKLV